MNSSTREKSMRTIEAQIHDILLDLLPEHYSNLNQAKIVAEATSIFLQTNGSNIKVASKSESGMMKALWTALATLSLDEDFDEEPDYVDGYGLDPSQIVRSAENSFKRKNNFKMSKIAMEIINDDDLSALLDVENESNLVDNNKYDFDDAKDETRHRKDVFKSPGDPKHRTDSTVI